MAVPEYYDYTPDGTFAVPYYRLLHGLLDLGIGRYLPDSTFLPSGDYLTEDECRTWVALGNRNYANIDTAREANMAKDNAAVVSSGDKPEVPMLMFVSTGKGNKWMETSYRFAGNMPNVKTIELDCGHYIFHYEADKMTEEINLFLYEL